VCPHNVEVVCPIVRSDPVRTRRTLSPHSHKVIYNMTLQITLCISGRGCGRRPAKQIDNPH